LSSGSRAGPSGRGSNPIPRIRPFYCERGRQRRPRSIKSSTKKHRKTNRVFRAVVRSAHDDTASPPHERLRRSFEGSLARSLTHFARSLAVELLVRDRHPYSTATADRTAPPPPTVQHRGRPARSPPQRAVKIGRARYSHLVAEFISGRRFPDSSTCAGRLYKSVLPCIVLPTPR